MVSVKKVTDEDGFWHVRFRPPGQFEEIRTPDWAAVVAGSVVMGGEVRIGRTPAGNWLVQTVLVPDRLSKSEARQAGQEIQRKIEEE